MIDASKTSSYRPFHLYLPYILHPSRVQGYRVRLQLPGAPTDQQPYCQAGQGVLLAVGRFTQPGSLRGASLMVLRDLSSTKPEAT
jgi:hypothetical protein